MDDVRQALDGVIANPAAYARSILLTVVVIAALIALFKVGPRLWRAIEEVFFTNWQLTLLGTAALVLSLAGGWTTWDGMRTSPASRCCPSCSPSASTA